jgi:NTP pyrophosphatase (non-canonical NTP hydrolase)
MADEDTTLHRLKEDVARFRDERGWGRYHNPKDLAVSISIEAAELLEVFQWKGPEEVRALLGDEKGIRRVREELADVVVYCVALADVLGIDLSEAISEKMRENAEKYPVDKTRGVYRKYTEL